MYGQATSAKLDLSRFRLTRIRVFGLAALFLSIATVVSIIQYSAAKDLILPAGGFVGGDYLAFFAAGTAARAGEAVSIYDAATFEALLHEVGPVRERYGLTWQYPPTYFLLLAPFAFLPYVTGYVLWTAGTAAVFFGSLRAVGLSALFLFVILASPSTFHTVITGQNGFLTAGLLGLAAFFPDKRPIVAGLAAALLTMKPHLGVLIPVAYIAAGCWRAFAVAAIGAAALAAASVLAFGPETWTAFVGGATGAAGNVAAGLMPLYKMTTPFAAFRLAGVPAELAVLLHAIIAVTAIVAIAVVWRRVKDGDLRAAALVAGIFLLAPYGYYYELIMLALPVAFVTKRALASGWLPYEQLHVLLITASPLLVPGQAKSHGVAWGFVIVLAVAALVLRRIAHEHPAAIGLRFKFASGAFRPRQD